MNLLLTCSTTPEFSPDALNLWNKFCIAEWIPGDEIVSYLKFAAASSSACIDAIVFLRSNLSVGLTYGPDGASHSRDVFPWQADFLNALISKDIRNLPDTCAMRDGRKWKRIPQIVLTDRGYRSLAYVDTEVDFVLDVTDLMLFGGYGSPITWIEIEKVINQYHQKAAAGYERIGFLITADHGRYRVKRAFRKKNSFESEFYYGGKDQRRFREYVTIGRDSEGIEYEAILFEQLLNNPTTGEREVHQFFEQHPDILAEAMMGFLFHINPIFPKISRLPILR